METLINKYADKLVTHGLCEPGVPLVGGLDAELVWNRKAPEQAVLQKVVDNLNINSILFATPSEPYASIINQLTCDNPAAIHPEDCETRTFLHDIPVAPAFAAEAIIDALKKRKSVIVPGAGIVTTGTVSPEQTFVVFSSVCFACFVKFFSDAVSPVATFPEAKYDADLMSRVPGIITEYKERVTSVLSGTELMKGPLTTEKILLDAMDEAGRLTVEARMVDSFFGNVSCRLADTIYISQTGSSLDELAGVIDACPMDGSSCAGVTASSELTAHRLIYETGDRRTILHGHPRFSVIMSMYCPDTDCANRGQCHIKCTCSRQINDIPIVPGEVGTGPHGLCHTLPPAIADARGAIVHSHGLFTAGAIDFTDAMTAMAEIEMFCADAYLDLFKRKYHQ